MDRPVNDEVKYLLLKGKKISTKKEFHIRTLQIIGTNKQNAHATPLCCFEANTSTLRAPLARYRFVLSFFYDIWEIIILFMVNFIAGWYDLCRTVCILCRQ